MAIRLIEKLHLSAKGLLKSVRQAFQKVSEPKAGPQGQERSFSIADCLMAALAVFKFKFPSLLQFDEAARNDIIIKKNLKNLFGIEDAPSDTHMRRRLDEVDPEELRPAFTTVFAALQRGKALEQYAFLDGKYLLLCDGTGQISSENVCCGSCCEKHHKNGRITYYHQMVGAVIAHPDLKPVIPLCPEPIRKEDGAKKNDCERNATERLLRKFRQEHPHLAVIVTEDALSSNGPHIKLLNELNLSFILTVKEDGNKSLFEWVNGFEWNDPKRMDPSQGQFSYIDENKHTHKFRFVNFVPLNDSHQDLMVNFIEYWEMDQEGTVLYHNSWVTNILITRENAYDIARGGRARWKIENETFNTLKNQGYHFEHNFGHGNKNLSTVLQMLMMLAFLIDQAEQLCCGLFQGALKKLSSRKMYLWERIRGLLTHYIIPSWDALYRAIIEGYHKYAVRLDSS